MSYPRLSDTITAEQRLQLEKRAKDGDITARAMLELEVPFSNIIADYRDSVELEGKGVGEMLKDLDEFVGPLLRTIGTFMAQISIANGAIGAKKGGEEEERVFATFTLLAQVCTMYGKKELMYFIQNAKKREEKVQ